MGTDTTTIPKRAMKALAAGGLSEEQARQIVAIGADAAVLLILELSKQLAGVLEKVASADWRRHSAVATQGGSSRRHVRLGPRPAFDPIAGVDRYALGRLAREAVDQTPSASSKRPVHVLGPTECSFREQHCRASDSACRDHSQKQLRQPKPAWRRQSSGSDVDPSHPQTARPRPDPHHRLRPDRLPHHRTITPTT